LKELIPLKVRIKLRENWVVTLFFLLVMLMSIPLLYGVFFLIAIKERLVK